MTSFSLNSASVDSDADPDTPLYCICCETIFT
jgi:hypothetical protein